MTTNNTQVKKVSFWKVVAAATVGLVAVIGASYIAGKSVGQSINK